MKTKIGYYRSDREDSDGGNFIRVHWLSMGPNSVDSYWYSIKSLRLWRPAPTPVALFVFLKSGENMPITMPLTGQTSNDFQVLRFTGSIAVQV